MWSDEQLNDAIQVLWNASQNGNVEKVTDKEKEPTEMYIVANDVAYTDPLYLKALDKLLSDHKFEAAESSGEVDRECFRRIGGEDNGESFKAI